MTKLMIIGIDSLEIQVIKRNIEKLPNFKKILDRSVTTTSESVFPVDTIPAWATIYTGKHPGNHGLLYSYDVFDPKLDDLRKLELTRLQGHSFWDYVGQAGNLVGVVNPVLAYPPWPVNGFMISKSPFDSRINKIETTIPIEGYPTNIINKYDLPTSLKSVWGGHPGKSKLIDWSNKAMASLQADAEMGLKLCKGEEWDLFFIYFSQLDIVQHRLWRFFDPLDPTYPGKTKFDSIILDFYYVLDRIVGDFRSAYEDSDLLLLSDHGHKVRPYNTVNINHILTRMELHNRRSIEQQRIERIKRAVFKIFNKLELETVLLNFVTLSSKLTSLSKSIYSSSGGIDVFSSKASLSSFAGIKSYPHGGIKVNSEIMPSGEYNATVEKIINELRTLRLEDGRPMFEWMKKRDEFYPGMYTEKIFPDILFELQDDYGVGWDNDGEVFGHSYDHNVASGGHSKKAVLFVNSTKPVFQKDVKLMDVAPSILHLMNIDRKKYNFDGKSIFEVKDG